MLVGGLISGGHPQINLLAKHSPKFLRFLGFRDSAQLNRVKLLVKTIFVGPSLVKNQAVKTSDLPQCN